MFALKYLALLPLALAAPSPSSAPVAPASKIIDPQWPFTDNCTSFHLDTAGGSVALRTVCPIPGARVTSELSFESTMIGTDVAITPSFPSGTAHVPFSSVCKNCRLDPPSSTTMFCDCSSNTAKPISIDLYWWITTLKGVACFTDGAVCAQAVVTTPELIDALNGTEAADTIVARDVDC